MLLPLLLLLVSASCAGEFNTGLGRPPRDVDIVCLEFHHKLKSLVKSQYYCIEFPVTLATFTNKSFSLIFEFFSESEIFEISRFFSFVLKMKIVNKLGFKNQSKIISPELFENL